MKLPTSVNISGVTYKVQTSKAVAGGLANLNSKVIMVGTGSPKEMKEIFYHEVIEAILHERGHRYVRYEEGNDGIRFVMTHHDFENVVRDIAAALG